MVEPVVTVKQGKLKGLTDIDLNGDTYYKFLGIPYAKPPIGPLRFKAPQPAEAWASIRDATKEGNPCLAAIYMEPEADGSEDCLYLNVFTKNLPRTGLTPKPVMVFIHGGGFFMGSGSEVVHGAKFLMAEDIVLVVINYRVGIFGFLSSDDLSLEIPGNAGLKDQTFALKWVQENIANFNGDPNNVTIFGCSAGGASVSFQVISPTAKGLFHKAIAQSGSAFNPWAWGQKNAVQVAEKLGKRVSNDREALDILMSAPTDELFQASLKIPHEFADFTKRRPFGPVIEKPNPTAFITKNPSDIMASGNFNQVPLIQGTTSNEMGFSEAVNEEIGENMKPQGIGVPWIMGIAENSPEYAKLKTLINKFYLKDRKTSKAVSKYSGDVGFVNGVIESTKLIAKSSLSPVYLYVFSYKIPLTKLMLKFFTPPDDMEGVPHGSDQMFLFYSELDKSEYEKNPKAFEERKVAIKKVTKIWTDFARTGRPHKNWETVTDINELKYFDIDKDPQMKVNPFADTVAFWSNVSKDLPDFNARFHENAEF